MKKKKLTHLTSRGEVHMVGVTGKAETHRAARATATLVMKKSTRDLLFAGDVAKGDALAVARIAGILAAKRTSELVPLCHPVGLTKVHVAIDRGKKSEVTIVATAETRDRTGVEMEALTAASIAALTLYDMLKSVERGITFSVKLDEKKGGASGEWKRKGT